jgi:hypothetical protein
MQRDVLPSKKPVYQQYKVYADQLEGMHGASRLPDCFGAPLSSGYDPLLPHPSLTLSGDTAFFKHTFS